MKLNDCKKKKKLQFLLCANSQETAKVSFWATCDKGPAERPLPKAEVSHLKIMRFKCVFLTT